MSSPAASAPPVRETRHALKLRHKAELKALLAAPAKGIGAKKAQKDAAAALEAKHALEAAELERREQADKEAEEKGDAQADGQATEATEDAEEEDSAPAAAASAAPAAGKQPSRAQQKKAKAAQKDAARMAQLRAETAGMKDERGEENAAIAKLLALPHSASAPSAPSNVSWRVKEMVSDGHCLYRALADQAAAHHLHRDLPLNDNVPPFLALRQLCAQYMRTHRDEFAPFMLTDEGEAMDDAGWEAYLRSLESESDAVWGGHTEIVALSKAMRRPIRVWSAAGKMDVGEEFGATAAAEAAAGQAAAASPEAASSPLADGEPLNISFHKHYFGLGNHYNSIVRHEEDDEFSEQVADKLNINEAQ